MFDALFSEHVLPAADRIAVKMGLRHEYAIEVAKALPLDARARRRLQAFSHRDCQGRRARLWRQAGGSSAAFYAAMMRVNLASNPRFWVVNPPNFAIWLDEAAPGPVRTIYAMDKSFGRQLHFCYSRTDEALKLSWSGHLKAWRIPRDDIATGRPAPEVLHEIVRCWGMVTRGEIALVRITYAEPNVGYFERGGNATRVATRHVGVHLLQDWRWLWRGDTGCLISVHARRWDEPHETALVQCEAAQAHQHALQLGQQGVPYDAVGFALLAPDQPNPSALCF